MSLFTINDAPAKEAVTVALDIYRASSRDGAAKAALVNAIDDFVEVAFVRDGPLFRSQLVKLAIHADSPERAARLVTVLVDWHFRLWLRIPWAFLLFPFRLIGSLVRLGLGGGR
jgi:hypothetical protein